MADTLYLFSIIAFVLAGIMLIVSIVLFVGFRIPKVIGDLSGKTARRTIAGMRKKNEQMGQRFAELKKNKPATEPLISKTQETDILKENMIQTNVVEETEILEINEGVEGVTEPLMTEASPAATEFVARAEAERIEIINEIIVIHTNEILR